MKIFGVILVSAALFLIVTASAYAAACDSYYCDGRFIKDNSGDVGDADIDEGFLSMSGLSPEKIKGIAWTKSNDGAYSGLDADLLDGKSASYFADSDHDHYWDYASFDHKHLNLGVSTDFTDIAYVNDDAYEIGNKDIRKGTIKPAKIYGKAWTRKNDGPGSGLNADMLDGYHVKKLLNEIAALKTRVAALEAR